MSESPYWSLPESLSLFVLSALLILIFGVMMTRVTARLADRTGLGETVLGALLLGAATSLPEIATSVTAASGSHPDLALSNAIGSVAGQTAFLAIADMAYTRANLEHAAASAENLLLGALLVLMLAFPIIGIAMPSVSLAGIHPVTPLMFVAYVYGMRLVSRVHERPMWMPTRTGETRTSESAGDSAGSISSFRLWLRFGFTAFITAISGWLMAHTAISLSVHTGISETLMGGVLTGLVSSLPELVVALVSVRMGALSLAVGGVLGGNCFDVLIVGFSDLAYPNGTVYGGAGPDQDYLLALTVLLNAILLMGMLYRERHGVANIGLESFLLLLFYLGGMGLLLAVG